MKSSKLTNIDCILCIVSMNIVYNEHEISGELAFPSCLLAFVDDSFMVFQLNQLQTSSKFIASGWSMTSLSMLDVFNIVFLQEL